MLTSMNAHTCMPIARPLDSTIRVPGSKSITNRALIVAALADGHSLLTGLLLADDTRLMIDVVRALGVAITVDESAATAEVSGCGGQIPASEAELFCGNAGTVMRFGTALAAAGFGRFAFDGVERMRQRPIGGLADALRRLGTGIEYIEDDGYPPLVVHASGLRGGHVMVDSPESSQMISALLLAAPYAISDVMIEATGQVPSVPYLIMTTALMDRFGVAVVEQYKPGNVKFIVSAPQRYQGRTLAIEPDASNASYFLAAPAIAGGRVTVKGLGTESIQGDARFVDVLERMGCEIERRNDSLTVRGPSGDRKLQGIDIDLNDMPDTAQTLAVTALFAEGPTTIRNVANLRVKETDRITALATGLGKLGARVDTFDDGLTIVPPAAPTPAAIDTYEDHRMAMSFALAGLRIPGLVINDPDCCSKTFPDFFERFTSLAGR